MKNAIYVRRKNKILLEPGSNQLGLHYIATLLKNIESLGYTFSPAAIERLQTLSLTDLTAFSKELETTLLRLRGANVAYEPMYPNFPRQVMKMDEARLYINALIHYFGDWIGQRLMPDYEKEDRPPLLENVDLSVLDLGDEADFLQICRNLLAAKTSLSATDKEDVTWLITQYQTQLAQLLPEIISHKENLAYLTGLLLGLNVDSAHIQTFLTAHFKTATDVLRLATALSAGDVSLAQNTRFRQFRRPERRLLLALLENCTANPNTRTEDMLRHKKRWLRLGERLHPFEYKKRYPQCAQAFDILRNNKPFATFNSQVEQALEQGQIDVAAELLQNRPGELARRLDHLLRRTTKAQPIIDRFSAITDKISTPVLLQVLAHFNQRNYQPDLRVFFPKGNVGKAYAIENTLPELDETICLTVSDICRQALHQRFVQLSPLGQVYVDEALQDFIVPFSQRSASKALRTLVRGTKLPMPTGRTIRFFLWWKEGLIKGVETGRVDIDLSAVMYDRQWQYVEHISYTNLKSEGYQAAHSGDITSAPNGACEFIDLDIESVVRHEGRYVVMSLLSYTGQPFCNLPECYAGWILRQEPESGEIFEPQTVQNKIDVAADTRICIPLILDLVERQIIWTDLALTRNPAWYNNIEGNQKGMTLMGKALTNLVKPNLYQLFHIHAIARGSLTPSVEEADTIFAVEQGITPFDMDVIMAEFL